jgi:single-stranded-DNA-specific exonuclease
MYLQGIKKRIVQRPQINQNSRLANLDPVLLRILTSRGIQNSEQLDHSLSKLPNPWLLTGMQIMAEQLSTAVIQQKRICVVADFDADGATSCAVAIKGLELLGAKTPDFIVPNRFEYGYGLTPEIVALAAKKNPDIILTVDNGISSLDGVKAAKAAGIKVLITDHHLPGGELPAADAIVNPNLVEDKFPSRNIAGVGVIFYVLMALRIRLRELNWFQKQGITEPNLAQLLDYVALGTIADVVAMDHVNRILVHNGLQRIRAGSCHIGIRQLTEITGKELSTITASDLGFLLAPRLNAAGRLEDMSLGIQCLISDNPGAARHIADQLDALNQERKVIEERMKSQAMALLAETKEPDEAHAPSGICMYESSWHQGVIGILAARIKDKLHRPVIAFAPADHGELKGSARSIAGVHIRDVLSEIAAAYPQVLSKFGGHAMAAGLTIKMQDFPHFALLFDQFITSKLEKLELEQQILSDGELDDQHMTIEFAELLQQAAIWGQAFPEPLFNGVFDVIQCRIVGKQHLKFVLRQSSSKNLIDGIAFFADHPEHWLGCRKINAAYKLDINYYRGQRSMQLQLHYLEKLD